MALTLVSSVTQGREGLGKLLAYFACGMVIGKIVLECAARAATKPRGRRSLLQFWHKFSYFRIRQATNKQSSNSELQIKHSELLAAVPAAG